MPTELARLPDTALADMTYTEAAAWQANIHVTLALVRLLVEVRHGVSTAIILTHSPMWSGHILYAEAELPQPVGRVLPLPWVTLPSASMAAPESSGKT